MATPSTPQAARADARPLSRRDVLAELRAIRERVLALERGLALQAPAPTLRPAARVAPPRRTGRGPRPSAPPPPRPRRLDLVGAFPDPCDRCRPYCGPNCPCSCHRKAARS